MASVSLVINVPATDLTRFNQSGEAQRSLGNLSKLLQGMAVGALTGTTNVFTSSLNPVRASATATLATAEADNTITIGGTLLTAKASPAGESQWLVTGSDTVVAAALAAAINAHSVLSLIVSATSAIGVVTITCVVPGAIGNQVPVVRVGAPITLSSATLVSGAGGPAGVATVYTR